APRAAGSARSPTQATASSGRVEDLAAAVTVSRFTSANTVRTPSPTSACAIARPLPLPAPVTRAASRARSNGIFNRLMSVVSPSRYLRHNTFAPALDQIGTPAAPLGCFHVFQNRPSL